MRQREIQDAIKTIQKAKSCIKDLNKKYARRLKNGIDQIAKSAIAKWYAAYDPIYYRRTGDLVHAYKITVQPSKKRWELDFGPEYMRFDHHQDNDYIFENSFIGGYHGGDTIGEGHPNPGTPYWRTPFPGLYEWGREAYHSISPYEMITKIVDQYVDELQDELQNEYNDKVVKKIQKAINRFTGGA